MKNIRLLIADDHAIVRTGLVSLLSATPGMEVVGDAEDGRQAIAAAERLRPDVVLLDLMMPKVDGATATAEIRARSPETRILILTTFGTSSDLARALENGAHGVLLKSVTNDELLDGVRQVASGQRVLSPEVRQMLQEDPTATALSPRQLQILDSITRGLSNAQIAAQYDISLESVKTHVKRLLGKIGAANRSEAAAIALRKHLLKI